MPQLPQRAIDPLSAVLREEMGRLTQRAASLDRQADPDSLQAKRDLQEEIAVLKNGVAASEHRQVPRK